MGKSDFLAVLAWNFFAAQGLAVEKASLAYLGK